VDGAAAAAAGGIPETAHHLSGIVDAGDVDRAVEAARSLSGIHHQMKTSPRYKARKGWSAP
jgi:hypothetical protein